jgi:protease-4
MGVSNSLRRRTTGPLILELDLSDGLAEGQPADAVQAVLAMRRTRLLDVLDGLRRAATDNRVHALVVKVGGGRIGLARIQELRNAVTEFRKSGKLTVAWSESFGEFTRGNLPYYLATAFEKIYLQPSGVLGLTGIAVEQVFVHDALAKLGIDFESGKRYEYKTAADPLTETGFTGPARETVQRMAESVVEQLMEGIASGRGASLEEARGLLDRGPFLAHQALEAGLVDALGYRDEVYEDVRRSAGKDATPQPIARYHRVHALAELPRRAASAARDPQIALIYAHGTIRQGRAPRGPFGGGGIGSDTMAAAIRAATSDSRVRSIVLRVSSPGGSAVASDTIWREVVRARAVGKPVVVSMGDVAASGGYYISMGADVIVTQPGTITGSIGVIMGKPVFRELFARAGVTTDTIALGAHGSMFSTARPFSEDEWARVDEWLDAIYTDFTSKVAQARHLSASEVDELARGRVWTGADAVRRGLADEVGGLRDALAIARQRAGLPDSAPVRLFPRVSPLDQLRTAESGPAALLSSFVEGWGPVGELAARAGLPPYGPLMLPGHWTIT